MTKELKPLRELVKQIILRRLETFDGNRTHTAQSLGIGVRTLAQHIYVYQESGTEVKLAKNSKGAKKVKFTEVLCELDSCRTVFKKPNSDYRFALRRGQNIFFCKHEHWREYRQKRHAKRFVVRHAKI
jgi:hypothetical protein